MFACQHEINITKHIIGVDRNVINNLINKYLVLRESIGGNLNCFIHSLLFRDQYMAWHYFSTVKKTHALFVTRKIHMQHQE